ncbi:MAG TPA: TetR family transcriptional regulator [Candidatus Solibacter sp.]|jgi:AcrR family transcriptional regulator|nr:TetR family transcriptional regulator [Candidatus Solibacter sp.]
MAASGEPRPEDPRKQRARATRRRMVEAAYKLFSERGYTVPLTDVAKEAGVAVQTVYFTFHTKAELMGAVLELAVLGDDLPLTPIERPWFAKLLAEPDPRKALQIFVDATTEIIERVGPLSPSISRSGDPDVDALWRHSEQLRIDGYRKIVEAVVRKGKLRRGLTLDEAVDITFVLLAPPLYNEVVRLRGWTVDRWRKWMGQTLADAIFG